MSDLNGDIHALSGAYAVDALDDLERARFARHLAECSECQAEVDSLREAAAMLPELTTLTPSGALRQRVLAEIATVRPLAPVVTTHPAAVPSDTARSSRPGRPWLRGLVAAAAVVATLGAGGIVWDQLAGDDTSQVPPTLSAAEQVLASPDAVTRTQKLGQGGEATVVASRSLNKIVVMTKNLPPLTDDQIYEMWIRDAQKGMVKAGLMTAEDATVVLDGDIQNATGAGITVEPAGGSHVPTTTPIAEFSFENA